MKNSIAYLLLAWFAVIASWAQTVDARYANSSVLAEGKWVKLRVQKNGIYKLTDNELKRMGFNDPKKVSVHGYGGGLLPEYFKADYIDDLPATAIYRGKDFLLFYAQGPLKWEYNALNGLFERTENPYSLYGYYFLTDATDVKSMQTQESVEGASLQISDFDDYSLHEKNLVSVSESGRELYGESFAINTVQNFSFTIPGITDHPGKITLSFIAKPIHSDGYAGLSIGSTELISMRFPVQSISDTYTRAVANYQSVDWNGPKDEKTTVSVSYSKSGDVNVYLDYIFLQMKRKLQLYGATTFFRSLQSVDHVSRFNIDNIDSETLVFDVTDKLNPCLISIQHDSGKGSFVIPKGSLREFVAVRPSQLIAPEIVGTVENQNLHGESQVDMVILSPTAFKSEADRLASLHRSQDGIEVRVVTPELVYNEFSSGTPDATAIRRFMKMFYDRSSKLGRAPKYLLLFGDGSYDNRGLTSTWKNIDLSNYLITYQSKASLNTDSYVTDDYFGFLDDEEGANIVSDDIDIGIGRFPMHTLDDATAMVDKIERYMSNGDLGEWKNNVTFVADDGNNADRFTTEHARQADWLADYLLENEHSYHVNKLFLDAYKKQQIGGNQTYPEANAALQKQFKEGLFLINYVGHGSTRSWADEKILDFNDITQATYSRLPLWITATCDFTRFDALATSAGEEVFLNKKSGGIALYTTTRTVASYDNFILNQALIKNLFTKESGGMHLRLGDVMKQTKRALTGSNKLNFILIGDPALLLNFPKYQVLVTEINGESVVDKPIVLKALQRVTVSGVLKDPNGNLDESLNGLLKIRVMDSKTEKKTLGNNKVSTGGETVVRQYNYSDYTNTIYLGSDSVQNGKFSFTFTVPKDILYLNDSGRMSFYFCSDDSKVEAHGGYVDFKVGGSEEGGDKDETGPEIRAIYFNDSTFVDGGTVNNTPLFVAEVFDENGINITGSSLGHDIVLRIDNNPAYTYILNSFFENQSDGELPGGRVVFPLPETLSNGLHAAEFKVWDVLNNSSTQTVRFRVDSKIKPDLQRVMAAPNPARESVTFCLQHNRPESMMEISIQVFDMAGRLQWNHTEKGSSELFKTYNVKWNLKNNSGQRLRPGLFLYRAVIRTVGAKSVSKAGKLIVLGQ